jgi:hypothetical protein
MTNHCAQLQQNLPIHLIRTRDAQGAACYFILRASKADFIKLSAKRHKEPLNISDYGDILARGYGDKPDRHQAQKLRAQYDVDFNA